MANPTTMTLALLLLFMVPINAFPREDNANEPTPTPSESPSSFAALDEVRLVANGLLQLGRNLRNFVQKTKSQINTILHKLTLFNTSFNQLSVLTSKIKEEEKELKKTTVVLKVKNEEIKNLSLEMKSKVKDIMKERIQLWNQVGGIEEKLSGLSQGLLTADQAAEISALKEVIQDQERSISGLLKAVKQQSEHLNDQKNMIKNLENKLNSTRLQETLLKFSGDAKIYSISDYLPHYSTDESFSTDFPRHCGDVFSSGDKSSGLYPIKPNGSEPFLVYCEFTEEGAFTVIQRRHGGSVDFNQSWQGYEDGFGDFKSEFWLGLRKIFSITQQGSALLHIQLENCKQEKHSVEIQYILEGPDSNYTIHLKPGDMTSGLDVPTGLRFSTKDHNDRNRSSNPTCINDYSASWWFSICGDVNLNGKCIPSQPRRKGVQGKQNKGQYQLKSTQISIHHRQDSQHSHTNQKK